MLTGHGISAVLGRLREEFVLFSSSKFDLKNIIPK